MLAEFPPNAILERLEADGGGILSQARSVPVSLLRRMDDGTARDNRIRPYDCLRKITPPYAMAIMVKQDATVRARAGVRYRGASEPSTMSSHEGRIRRRFRAGDLTAEPRCLSPVRG